jgi:hypothetical protein
MRDEWFPYIKFKIGWKEFHQLPKNPAYKWEYFESAAHLTARPKSYHCVLELRPSRPPRSVMVHHHEKFSIRRLRENDWDALPRYFAAAFSRIVPFCGMEGDEALAAARACVKKTHSGGEGPVIKQACYVATARDGEACAAILITLTRRIDLTSLESLHWKEPPRAAIRRRLGRPHLTWIFVPPLMTRFGLGTALLAHASNALLRLGYSELASTFLLGNESSTLWHWMNGFRLVSYSGSYRAFERHPVQIRPMSKASRKSRRS